MIEILDWYNCFKNSCSILYSLFIYLFIFESLKSFTLYGKYLVFENGSRVLLFLTFFFLLIA